MAEGLTLPQFILRDEKDLGYCTKYYNTGRRHQGPATTLSLCPKGPSHPSGCHSYRQVHLHRGEVPPGETDGLLPDPDVHPQPAHRHPLLGLLLDQHRCGTGPGGLGHHHRAHHDHTKRWLPCLPAQGQCQLHARLLCCSLTRERGLPTVSQGQHSLGDGWLHSLASYGVSRNMVLLGWARSDPCVLPKRDSVPLAVG